MCMIRWGKSGGFIGAMAVFESRELRSRFEALGLVLPAGVVVHFFPSF